MNMRKLASWSELLKVLERLGYEPVKPRSTGGSAVPFIHKDHGTIRSFHKPHHGAVIHTNIMAKRLGISREQFMELAE